MNISNEDWEKAKNHTLEMRDIAVSLGPTGIFYVMGCNQYLQRYEIGERTPELYNDMINLH